jgi:hypothetical protein
VLIALRTGVGPVIFFYFLFYFSCARTGPVLIALRTGVGPVIYTHTQRERETHTGRHLSLARAGRVLIALRRGPEVPIHAHTQTHTLRIRRGVLLHLHTSCSYNNFLQAPNLLRRFCQSRHLLFEKPTRCLMCVCVSF